MFTAKTPEGNVLGGGETLTDAVAHATTFLNGPRGASVVNGFEIYETRLVATVRKEPDGEVSISYERHAAFTGPSSYDGERLNGEDDGG